MMTMPEPERDAEQVKNEEETQHETSPSLETTNTPPTTEGATKQELSFTAEQMKYWQAFVQDLFLGTLKRLTVSSLVFGLAFLAIAYLIYRLSIKPQSVWLIVKMLEAALLFLMYLIIGPLTGLLHGVVTTLLKKTEELERGVNLTAEHLMAMILAKIPGGEKNISTTDFNILLDEQIQRFTHTAKMEFRLFSLMGAFLRFFLRLILQGLRYILLHDFLDYLEEHNETRIHAGLVDAFYREKLIASVMDSIAGRLELFQYLVYGILGLFLVLPVVLMILPG